MELLQNIIHRYFPVLLIPLGFLIVGIFLSGGFTVESFWGDIRCRSLDNPILLEIILAAFWIVTGRKCRQHFAAWFSLKNILAWGLMLLGSLGFGLWIWDFYQPGLIWKVLLGGKLTHGQEASLENFIWFWPWFMQFFWLFLSHLHSRSGKYPLPFSLGKVAVVLSLLIFSFIFISFYPWEIVEDYRFIIFSFFLGILGLALGWVWPIQIVSETRVRKYLWIGIGLFFVIFIILSQARYSIFRVYEDFPQSAQALWSTLHGRFMNITFWVFEGEGRSFFAQHFQPLILLFVPLYAAWSDPRFLLVLCVLGTSLAALPLYGIVKGRLENPWLALGFVVVYLHSPLIQRGTLHDFHLENFVPLLFFLAFYFLQKGKTAWHWVTCLALLSVREDCFIYVVLMGLYAIFFEKKKKAGWIDLLLGAGWVLIALGWIVPFLKDENSHVFAERYKFFEADGLFGLVFEIFKNPKTVYSLLTQQDVVFSILFLSVPLFFLPWLSLRALLFIMPLNLIFFLSSFSPLRILAAFYSFLILPCYLLGGILTAEKLLKRFRLKQGSYERVCQSLAFFLIVTTIVFNFFFKPSDTAKHGPFDQNVVESSPLGKEFHINYYLDSLHQRIGRELTKKFIPEGASLSTEMGFATHLSNRFILRVFPNYQGVDYIFLDLLSDPIKTVFRWDQRLVVRLLMRSNYGVVTYRDGWLLLKNGFSKNRNSGVLRQIFKSYGVLKFNYRTGSFMPDPDADYHLAIRADSKKDHAGFMIFGRYWNLPEGNYRAIFKLKTTRNHAREPIAQLSISAIKEGKRIVVSEKALRGTDFSFNHCYQDFVLNFDTRGLGGIEFRIAFLGYGEIWFEGIDLWAPKIPINQIYDFMTGGTSPPAKS